MSNRDIYVKKLQAKLDEWNAEIDRLEAKARGTRADVQANLNQRVEEMRSKRAEMARRLEELRHASEGAWEDMKAGLELAWESLAESLKSAWSHFE